MRRVICGLITVIVLAGSGCSMQPRRLSSAGSEGSVVATESSEAVPVNDLGPEPDANTFMMIRGGLQGSPPDTQSILDSKSRLTMLAGCVGRGTMNISVRADARAVVDRAVTCRATEKHTVVRLGRFSNGARFALATTVSGEGDYFIRLEKSL